MFLVRLIITIISIAICYKVYKFCHPFFNHFVYRFLKPVSKEEIQNIMSPEDDFKK